jgi:hypothetical protein
LLSAYKDNYDIDPVDEGFDKKDVEEYQLFGSLNNIIPSSHPCLDLNLRQCKLRWILLRVYGISYL